jgi:hypothetical protein
MKRATQHPEWLCGIWETEDRDSRVAFEVSKAGSKWLVRAYNHHDREEFVVSKLRQVRGGLAFETFVPSTNWRTKNFIKCVGPGELYQELTLIERWTRVSADELGRRKHHSGK